MQNLEKWKLKITAILFMHDRLEKYDSVFMGANRIFSDDFV